MNSNSPKEIIDRIYDGGLFFSILSLISSIFVLLIIIFNKILRSLTYNFLILIFISEILNSIGNIVDYYIHNNNKCIGTCNIISLALISCSDVLTMILFCFFSFCSIELIKKSNRNIKEKEILIFLISLGISLIYAVIICLIIIIIYLNNEAIQFRLYYSNFLDFSPSKSTEKTISIQIIHVIVLFCMTVYVFYNIINVINFLREKQKSDKINSWKIAKLNKVLFRFPLVCLLYWIFFILTMTVKDGKFKLAFIFRLFSVSFLRLRGLLISLNAIQTNKIQVILQRFIEIDIKHNLIYFEFFSKKKKSNEKTKEIDY
jgi:hypothetical protein